LDRLLFIAPVLMIYSMHFGRFMGAVYAAVCVGLVLERESALRLVRASWPLLLILALAGASAFWSVAPEETAGMWFDLLGLSAFAVYFACKLGLKAFVESLALAITISAAASILLAVFVPSLAIQDGAWQGMFSYKNQLGLNMALGLITVACLDDSRGVRRGLQIAAFLLCTGALIASKCATGEAATLIMLALILPLLLWSRRRRSVKPALAVVCALAAAVLSGSGFSNAAFALLGRDATLTGRTDIWQLTLDAIAEKPLVGYGYDAFWSEGGPWERYIEPIVRWVPGAAHNGYLEVALNIGIVGEILLILFLAVGVSRAAASFWRGRDLSSAWPLCVLLNAVITNATEATFMTHKIDWIVVVAAFMFATDATQRKVSTWPLRPWARARKVSRLAR
jgi:O-antigen ligase